MKLPFAIPLALALLAPASAAPAAGSPAGFLPGTPQSFVAAREEKAAPLLDLNSASKADLVKLPGLGDVAADKIIAGRPWRSKYDLVVKKVVTRSNYDKFSKYVVARQTEPK